MNKRMRREQRIEEQRSIIAYRASVNNKSDLAFAKAEVNKHEKILTILSIIGPLIISLLYVIFPISISPLELRNIIIDVSSTIIIIIALSISISKADILRSVVVKIESSKEYTQKQIDILERRIDMMDGNQTFYISATEMIGRAMKNGHMDLESLAKVLIAAIYHNLSTVTKGDNLTINLYELRNSRVRMIVSSTRLQYCERESIDIPELLRAKEGIDIKDEAIQEYYCIRCIRGKIKEKAGKYYADWKEIVKEFKWDGWEGTEKEEIINNNDRERCIESGFKYNQYFAFKIRRDDGTIGFFEIVANEHTTLASDRELNSVTNRLKKVYYPLLSVLWDITGVSNGKELS